VIEMSVDITQLKIPATMLIGIIAGVFFLNGWVDNGHKETEYNANIYTVNLEVARLTGIEYLYRAKSEAGVITPQEQARWQAVSADLQMKINESARLQELRAQL